MSGLGERVLGGADDQAAHQGGIAEADLGLGRMDIDVDQVRRHLEEERQDGMAVVRQEVAIGPADRAVEQLVAHRPAVDEEVLGLGIGAVEGRQADVAGQAQALALGVDRQRILGEVAAEDRREAAQARLEQLALGGRQVQEIALAVAEDEADPVVRHGEPCQGVARLHLLGPGGLEELEARGCRVEEVAHLDPGAAAERRRLHSALAPAFDGEAPGLAGVGGARRAAGDGHAADRPDRRQRLAAETEGRDVDQIVLGQLRGRMALDGERQFLRRHPVAVVAHREIASPAVAQYRLDVPGARVEGVLQQFLEGGGRPLDHLAGGDAVDQGFRQQAQAHDAVSSVRAAVCR